MPIREISCRTTLTLLELLRRKDPERVPQLVEGFREADLSNEWNWTSYQTLNLLFQRLEKLTRRDDIAVDAGRLAARSGAYVLVEWSFKLVPSLPKAFALLVRLLRRFDRVSDLRVAGSGPGRVVLENRCRPGFIRTRAACHYLRGLCQGLLSRGRVNSLQIHELECAVPIWEKGVIEHATFQVRDGRLWQEDLLTRQRADLGAVPADGRYEYQGTVYGSDRCVYEIRWRENPRFISWVWDYLVIRPRTLGRMRRELLDKTEIIGKQNSQLKRTNQVLASLLKERTELTANLEAKVAERTQELAYTVERLKDLDQMKSDFLSLTSHELRTPLTIIKGALGLLLDQGRQMDPERVTKYLKMAQQNANRLIDLIEELLDFSRLESGCAKLDLQDVDLVEIITDRMAAVQARAVQHQLTVSAMLAADLPTLRGDPARLRQVLDHLLANAVKFTPAGGNIRVHLRRFGSFAEIEVSDTGIGLTAEQQRRVFTRFFQADHSLTREAGGIGLGLTIVKELVRRHDGLIWVESRVNEGSHFFIRLPFIGPQKEYLAQRGAPDQPAAGGS